MTLSDTIRYAHKADQLYQEALDHFRVDRWSVEGDGRTHAVLAIRYQAKLRADEMLHQAFVASRQAEA